MKDRFMFVADKLDSTTVTLHNAYSIFIGFKEGCIQTIGILLLIYGQDIIDTVELAEEPHAMPILEYAGWQF